MSDTFKLPGSSYKELIKIIQAYGTSKKGVLLQLDEVSQSSGISRTIISRNNGFLMEVGLISDGNKKCATDLGIQLGRAYVNKIDDEIIRIWLNIISNNDFLNRMINMVTVKGEVSRLDFVNHIVYSSGIATSNNSRSGAGTIIEIFKQTGIIDEIDGKISLADSNSVDNKVNGIINNQENTNVSEVIEEKATSSITDLVKFVEQPYVCESGKEAKIIIPEDATNDDLYAIKDLLDNEEVVLLIVIVYKEKTCK